MIAGAEPVLYVERGGKGLQILVPEDDERLAPSLEALVESVQRSRIRRLAIERVNGEPVVGSPYEAILLDPTYSAKAMAGLIADVRAGRYPPGSVLVFIHTGGVPAVFADPLGALGGG